MTTTTEEPTAVEPAAESDPTPDALPGDAVTAAAPREMPMPGHKKKDDDDEDMPPMADAKGTPDRRWHSIAVFEGVWTGDYRMIAPEALTWRDLPRPLMAKTKTTMGHDDAEVVGRIDSAERIDASGIVDARTGEPHGQGVYAIRCEGVFLNDEFAARVAELIEGGFLSGVSVDLTDVDYQMDLYGPDGNLVDMDEASEEEWMNGTMRETVLSGRISELTVTPSEAFEGAFIELLDDEGNTGPATRPGLPTPAQQSASLRTVSEFRSRECVPCESGAITAAAAPVEPPKAWFDNPGLPGPTPLTVLDDGRVFGHLARWDVCHTGVSGHCVTAPRSATEYALFRTGAVKTAEGGVVSTGRVTVGTGHASTARGYSRTAAMAHYDDTGTAVADVAAGEDEHGIWLAGALRPDATAEQVRTLRGSPLSGDWRDAGAGLELIAALAVNTPGFPVLRQVVASGRPVALVASGPTPRAVPAELDEVRTLLPELRGIAERDRAGRAGAARAAMAASGRRWQARELRERMGVGG